MRYVLGLVLAALIFAALALLWVPIGLILAVCEWRIRKKYPEL